MDRTSHASEETAAAVAATWGAPHFLIDVSSGAAEGFSLEGLEGVHFISRAP
jgi:uncharacterized protein (DUF779 family)